MLVSALQTVVRTCARLLRVDFSGEALLDASGSHTGSLDIEREKKILVIYWKHQIRFLGISLACCAPALKA